MRAAPLGTQPALVAIVIPRPAPGQRALWVERLSPAQALLALLRSPRVTGLQDEELRRQQFDGLARVARVVPVFEARVPWGPPFAPELAAALCEAVGLRLASRARIAV